MIISAWNGCVFMTGLSYLISQFYVLILCLIPYLCSAPASQSLSTVAWVSASGLSTVAVKVMWIAYG
ncbi:MAG TPA: hypothetical protein IAC09_04730 [Candidatus Cryptobacteroides intestinipullorum]|nr:hypothetical protein [Candidatus Cryptobacteroides intestinipullorum]